MKPRLLSSALAVAAVTLALAPGMARADLLELPVLAPGAKTFSMFWIKDARKITPQRAIADLTKLLAPIGRLPCMVAGDRGTGVSCNADGVNVTTTHAYTYDLNQSIPKAVNELRDLDPKQFKGSKLPDGVGQTGGVNFLPPPTDGITPCVGACNQVGPITITFAVPITQFGVTVDTGNNVMLTDQMVVTINGQSTVRNLAFGLNELRYEDIDPNTGANVPFTTVTLEPLGGQTSAFLFDRIAYTK